MDHRAREPCVKLITVQGINPVTETRETDEMPSLGLHPSKSCRETLWWIELSTPPFSSVSLAATRSGFSGNKRQSETRWPWEEKQRTHPRICRNWGSKNPPEVAAAAAPAAPETAASAAPLSEDEGESSRRLPERKARLLKVLLRLWFHQLYARIRLFNGVVYLFLKILLFTEAVMIFIFRRGN